MEKDKNKLVWQQLFSVTDALRDSVAEDCRDLFENFTFNQLRMIKLVYTLEQHHPEGSTLKTLADKLSITPAAASEMVDSLVRRDFLSREQNPQDRRAISITLSKATKERFLQGEIAFSNRIGAFLSTLPEEDSSMFIDTLNQMVAFIENND